MENKMMDTKYLPPNITQAYKDAEENNFQGYILECIDVFDEPDDDLGKYYAYCKDIDAVISLLGKSGYHIGLNLTQVYDCCTYVIEPQTLAEKGYHLDLRIDIKEWLKQNKVNYKLSSEGRFIAS